MKVKLSVLAGASEKELNPYYAGVKTRRWWDIIITLTLGFIIVFPMLSRGNDRIFTQVQIHIEIDEKKPNGNGWDDWSSYLGSDPAPDPYGKIEFESGTCDI